MKYPVQPVPEPVVYKEIVNEEMTYRGITIPKMDDDKFEDFKARALRDRELIKHLFGHRQEGFWYADDKHNQHYPKFVNDGAISFQRQRILDAYDKFMKETIWDKDDRLGNALHISNNYVMMYYGSSPCRGCDNRFNGHYQYISNGWTWPQGYRHYIEVHNVIPSNEWLWDVLGIKL